MAAPGGRRFARVGVGRPRAGPPGAASTGRCRATFAAVRRLPSPQARGEPATVMRLQGVEDFPAALR
jgi:hypothetical protein